MNENNDEGISTGSAIGWTCLLAPVMCLFYTILALIIYNVFFR